MIKRFILFVLSCTVCVFAMAQGQLRTHVVQRGETIESIAKDYHVSVNDINKANPNVEGVIYVGMKLTIPAKPVDASNQVSNGISVLSGTANSQDSRSLAINKKPESNGQTVKKQVLSINYDEEIKLGFQFARIKMTYFFPTEKKESSKGHYSNGFNISFAMECEYVFNKNVFAGFGLGYMQQGGNMLDRMGDRNDFSYSQSKSQWHYVTIPLNVGYRMLISKKVCFDLYTGPVSTILVDGYIKNKIGSSDWVKTKLSDIDNVKRFCIYWNAGARINLWDFELGVEYWHSLSNINEGGNKGAVAVCLSTHI